MEEVYKITVEFSSEEKRQDYMRVLLLMTDSKVTAIDLLAELGKFNVKTVDFANNNVKIE